MCRNPAGIPVSGPRNLLNPSCGCIPHGHKVIRLTAKERAVLHLLEYQKYTDSVEVPPEMTQEGIAHAAGFDVAHFSEYVRPLVPEGAVRERQAHVKGIRQRRKVYELTESGRMMAVRLRKGLMSEIVRVRDAQGVHEATLAQVLEIDGLQASSLAVLLQSMNGGVLDAATLIPKPRSSLVEMLAEAPRVGKFVGRQAELEEITKEGDGPRVFVVRGVAGIGKSTFAAKACESVRGNKNRFWHRVRPWDTRESLLLSLSAFLGTLGRPALRAVLARGDTVRATRLFREDLPGTQSFLVFDDVHEASREALLFFRLLVEAIAAAPDVHAIILSRTKLSFFDRRDVVLSGLVRELDLAGLDPKEIQAFWADDESPPVPQAVSQHVGGHPLFLEMLRAHQHVHSRALRDIRSFVEEEIYEILPQAERRMMKLASLYEIPVPRDALLADPGWSHDVLLSLSNRSLLRPVGEELYEAHDTIRHSFAELLTPSERRELGAFAVKELRQLGSKASEAKDFSVCINYFSNALRLSASAEERLTLWESLGDVNQRLGDLPTILNTYGEAIKIAPGPEVLARLHRKMADVLLKRGEIAASFAELEAGLRALGDTVSVERGWLELFGCQALNGLGEPERARKLGESALTLFRQFGNLAGQAWSLHSLGINAFRRGDLTMADRLYRTALELAQRVSDPELTVELFQSMTGLQFFRTEDTEKVSQAIAAMEAVPGSLEDPFVRELFFRARSEFKYYVFGDMDGAARDNTQARLAAAQIQDWHAVAETEFLSAAMSAGIAPRKGDFGEARRGMEKAGEIYASLGLRLNHMNSLFWKALFSAMDGDREDFVRIANQITKTATEERLLPYFDMISGLARFVDGDSEGARVCLDRAVRNAEELRAKYGPGIWGLAGYTMPSFCYGVVLRAMGLEREGGEQIKRSLELRRRNRAWIAQAPDQERLLLRGLQRMMRRGVDRSRTPMEVPRKVS